MYAFAEPITVQQGAIEHAYKLIACLFTSVFKSGCGGVGGGVRIEQQHQKQQKPHTFGEQLPCAPSVGVRKALADVSQSN